MNHAIKYLFFIVSLFVSMNAHAIEEGAFTLESKVAAKKLQGVRLGNLQSNIVISIDVNSDTAIDVFVVNKQDFMELPDSESRLFESKAALSHQVMFKVKQAGDYYLVFDNRNGTKGKKINATIIIGVKPQRKMQMDELLTGVDSAKKQVKILFSALKEVFIFEDIEFDVVPCNDINMKSKATKIILCHEFASFILDWAETRKQAEYLLLFGLIHEIGHSLLAQWQYPFWNNEEVTDELAVVLLRMINQKHVIQTTEDLFNAVNLEKEIQLKSQKDDRHPVSVQRARNLKRWKNDPQLLVKWESVLKPRMREKYRQTFRFKEEE